MKLRIRFVAVSFSVFALFRCFSVLAALPEAWQYAQHFEINAPGLVKLVLPLDSLNASRPGLEDLRLRDDAGNELPYLIERPEPEPPRIQPAQTFRVSLDKTTTVITLETGTSRPLNGVSLETPAGNFIKAVRVEGSSNERDWRLLAEGQPLFREQSGASQLMVAIPPGPWHRLRLTVDDTRSQPIPFTGARIHAVDSEAPLTESLAAAIVERNENPGETRITLNLGAANLDIAAVHFETTEPLFKRLVTAAMPVIAGETVREQKIGEGSIYRVALAGRQTSENLAVTIETRVRSREMILFLRNQDSPPLSITSVHVERRPVHLVFLARAAGPHHLLTGNSRCDAPRYDLTALGPRLKNIPITPSTVSPISNNPDFRATEALAGVELNGVALDFAPWKFRKALKTSGGVQQVELDLDVLAHAETTFADLRLLRASNQVPYVASRTSINRPISPAITLTNDVKNPRWSRWIIRLPKAGLAPNRLSCETSSPLFERNVTLYEELIDERGDKIRRTLGSASWTQTPDRKSREFTLPLDQRLESDTLILETDNGDNPPIELGKFVAYYSATRLLFKTKPGEELFLYYGNPGVSPPRYDLSLIAGQLLAADKIVANLGAEEPLKSDSRFFPVKPGKGGVLFWLVLALVVATLFGLVARLLPKSSPNP
jgi:hypothetical protein